MTSSAVYAGSESTELSATAVGLRGLRPFSQLFAVFLCGSLAFLNVYCTQPLLPMLARQFHASEAAAGTTVSASTLGIAISGLLLALFAERVDRKKTIVFSMIAMAVCSILTSLTTTLPSLGVLRFFEGIVTPGVFIITIAYITEEWPAKLVPRVMSFYVAGTVFGGFMGRLLGGLIASHLSWRLVFLVLGVIGLCGAAATNRILRPASTGLHAGPTEARFGPLLRNIQDIRLVATFAIGFCMLYTLVAVFSYITFYLAAAPFDLTAMQLSWLFAVYLAGLAVTLGVGTVLAHVGLRSGMLGALTLCVMGIALTLAPSLVVIALGLATLCSGVFIAQTCANSYLGHAAPAGSRVSATGMYICSYYVGGTAGGIVPGLLWYIARWRGTALMTCALLLVAAVITFYGWRPVRDPDPIPL